MAAIDRMSLDDMSMIVRIMDGPQKAGKWEAIKEYADKYDINDWYMYKLKPKMKKKLEGVQDTAAASVFQTSTLLDAEGNVKLQWVKEKIHDKIAAFQEAVNEVVGQVPAKEEIPTPEYVNFDEENMVFYTIGDAHIGMLSWHDETGEDHNLALAETDLIKSMKLLLDQTKDTEECFIVDVGDYFHSDNSENKTARGGNALDVDGRYAKVLKVGLRIATELIEAALKKHKKVHWRSAIGNHNEHSAIMLNAFIEAFFRDNPRVEVHGSSSMFYYFTFGKNLIGITHGHTAKMAQLGEIMSVDCETEWSVSKYRYWYTGHIHHDRKMETRSCVVESFRTLAPKDAWHSASGYRSGQDMKAIILNKEYGEIARNTVNIRMIREDT